MAWHGRSVPVRILGRDGACGIEYSRLEPGAAGRGTLESLPADLVVAAIGEVATPPLRQGAWTGIRAQGRGALAQHDGHRKRVRGRPTPLTGPSKIGKAVYSGLRAARSLGNWLELKAQNRQTEFAGDDLISGETDRFPGGGFRDAPRVRRGGRA